MTSFPSNGPKKKKVAQRSFGDFVAEATSKANRAFIQQQVRFEVQQAAQALQMQLLNERAMMQTRQLAFERILKANVPWFNEEVLAMNIADIEDEAHKLDVVPDAAQEGDKVRLELQMKKEGDDKAEWGESSKLAIHSLMKKTKTETGETVQTHEALERELVGLKVGDTKEFLVNDNESAENPDMVRVRVNIKRVSRKPAPPPAPQAVPSEAAANV